MEKNVTFEEALKNMEDIAKNLEAGEQSLDCSLEMFEEGIKLYRYCISKLEEVEHKVQVIMQNSENEVEKMNLEIRRS